MAERSGAGWELRKQRSGGLAQAKGQAHGIWGRLRGRLAGGRVNDTAAKAVEAEA